MIANQGSRSGVETAQLPDDATERRVPRAGLENRLWHLESLITQVCIAAAAPYAVSPDFQAHCTETIRRARHLACAVLRGDA